MDFRVENLLRFLKRLSVFCLIVFIISFQARSEDLKQKTDSLKVALKTAKNQSRCEILLSLSTLYSLSNPSMAESYAEEALVQANKLGDSILIIKSKINLALAYRYQRKFQKVLDILNPTLTYINKIEDKSLIAEIFNNIGVAHFQLGHNNQSIGKFFKSLKVKHEINDPKGMSTTLNNIGSYYYQNKNYSKALEFYTKSMYFDSLYNDSKGLAFSFYNIGKVFLSMGNANSAKNYFKLALDVSKNLNNPIGKIYINYDLAEVYSKLNLYDSTLFYLDKADSLNHSFNINDAKTSILRLRGKIFEQQKHYIKAIPLLKQVNELYKSNHDSIKYILGLIDLGAVYKKFGNNYQSINEYTEALNSAEKYKLIWLKADALIGLAEIYKNIGNSSKSAAYLWSYVQIKDSISTHLKNNISQEIAVQQGVNELEKKIEGLQKDTKIQNLTIEREETRRQNLIILISILIPLLSWVGYLYYERRKAARFLAEKNEQIKQQNEELNAINEELNAINDQLNLSRQKLIKLNQTKDKFFSIVAHDLKSPLVSLRTYLYTIRTSQNQNQETFKNQVADIEKSLNTILDLLNNLLFWALSQEERIDLSPEAFNLSEIIEPEIELAKYLGKEKNIRIEHNIPSNQEIVTDKNMLLFIVRNLTSNALKYTPQNGVIQVLYNRDKTSNTVTVIDNGSGIEPSQLETLFDLEKKISKKTKGTGLGLMLCKEFLEKMGGEIRVESEVGKGSTFVVSFPDFSKVNL